MTVIRRVSSGKETRTSSIQRETRDGTVLHKGRGRAAYGGTEEEGEGRTIRCDDKMQGSGKGRNDR